MSKQKILIIAGVVIIIVIGWRWLDQPPVDGERVVGCQSEECFQERFVDCRPTEFIYQVGTVKTELEIKATGVGGCWTNIRFLEHPDQSRVGRSWECELDNSINFRPALELALDDLETNGSINCR